MSKVKKPQGKTTNKLVITFRDYSTRNYATVRESLKCNSMVDAEKSVAKRDKRRIFFYDFFDANGIKERVSVNTRDTILSV